MKTRACLKYFVHGCSYSLKKLNQTTNCDLSNLVQRLSPNNISLSMKKTELLIFRSPRKQIYKNLNFRLSGQKVVPKHHTKYLGVILDEPFSLDEYMNTLKQKLNGVNGTLTKLRYCVSTDILKIL